MKARRRVFKAMAAKRIAFCPTLAAGEANLRYRGWNGAEPVSGSRRRKAGLCCVLALAAGVPICMGGDVGVFTHGENAREMESMVAAGMTPAARHDRGHSRQRTGISHGGQDRRGETRSLCTILSRSRAIPTRDITAAHKVRMVMKGGAVIR